MILNRKTGWGDELEMIGWHKKDKRPTRYTVEDAVDSVTSQGGIESNIASIRKLLAAVLSHMPEEAALASINSVGDGSFVIEKQQDG